MKTLIKFAELCQSAGGNALLVGGSVRDRLWGLEPKDLDVEVYGLLPERVKELAASLGSLNEVGAAFGILKLSTGEGVIDISLPRRESKIGNGHKDFTIDADPFMGIEEASLRRDFTMNSLSQDILTGEIIDPWSGFADVRNRILRVTSPETFVEDPLRVMRAVQFVSRFDLEVESDTWHIMRHMVTEGELDHLPKERLREEWQKLFNSPKPSAGLQLAMEMGIFDEFPFIRDMPNTPQDPEWHPEGWELKSSSVFPSLTSPTQAVSINVVPILGSKRLWKLLDGSATVDTGDMATSMPDSINNVQSANVARVNSSVTSLDFSSSFFQFPETVITESVGFVLLCKPTFSADKSSRIVFKISNSSMLRIMNGSRDDGEVIRLIIEPVLIFVMNVFGSKELSFENSFHNNSMKPLRFTGMSKGRFEITACSADSKSFSVENNVQFTVFFKRLAEFDAAHNTQYTHNLDIKQGDVWTHTKMVSDIAAKSDDLVVKIAAFCHDFGKVDTTEFIDGRIRSRGHEEAGIKPTKDWLNAIGFSDIIPEVTGLVANHLAPTMLFLKKDEIRNGTIKRLARRISPATLEQLAEVGRADHLGRGPFGDLGFPDECPGADWLLERAKELGIERAQPEKIIKGRDLIELGLNPGPLFGELIEWAELHHLETEADKETLLDMIKEKTNAIT